MLLTNKITLILSHHIFSFQYLDSRISKSKKFTVVCGQWACNVLEEQVLEAGRLQLIQIQSCFTVYTGGKEEALCPGRMRNWTGL
jgi:hypothetical protein